MKLLVFGGTGQVGWELQRSLAPLGEVVAPDREGRRGYRGDLLQLEELARTVREVKPDVIVNAAAYTAVDRAESKPELARAINADAPALLAREARDGSALLVHYSTDYVFDGSGRRPWRPDDATGPLNVYGSTKLQGEVAIRESGCSYLVFRTSWVYSRRGSNFLRTFVRLARERDTLQVVDDQVGAPTGAELIADVTAHAIRRLRQSDAAGGIYHLTAAGETSWHGYARFILDCAELAGESSLRLEPDALGAVSSDAYPSAARRPRNSRLDCTGLERSFNLRLPDWRNGVRRALTEMLEKPS